MTSVSVHNKTSYRETEYGTKQNWYSLKHEAIVSHHYSPALRKNWNFKEMELETDEMQFVFYQEAMLSVTGWLRHPTNGALFSSSELKPLTICWGWCCSDLYLGRLLEVKPGLYVIWNVFLSNTQGKILGYGYLACSLVPNLHSILPAQPIASPACVSSKQVKHFACVGWMFPILVFHKMLTS